MKRRRDGGGRTNLDGMGWNGVGRASASWAGVALRVKIDWAFLMCCGLRGCVRSSHLL